VRACDSNICGRNQAADIKGEKGRDLYYLLNLEEQRRNKSGVFLKVQVTRGEDAIQADAIHARLENALLFKNSWLW
jgi:hypothetical protein